VGLENNIIGDRQYRDSDALARRELMDAWARRCEGAAGENVLAARVSGVTVHRPFDRF
jgi:hypothetical protein